MPEPIAMTSSVSFAAPVALACASVALAAAFAAAWVRRPAVPTMSYLLAGAGAGLLALAAGAPAWSRPGAGEVLVMVDVSPSTRAARYRDGASFRARVQQLLPGVRRRVVAFSGGASIEGPNRFDGVVWFPDEPADRTIFAPPPGQTVLLFSDARFQIPQVAPRVYVVVDPQLESPGDAGVRRLEARGDEAMVTLHNGGGPRELTLSGAEEATRVAVSPGPMVVARKLAASPRAATVVAPTVVARLNAADVWPENDVLSLSPPPQPVAERWWVGAAAPPPPSDPGGGTWRVFRPSELPTDPAAYLAPAVVVLDNVPADGLSPTQSHRLTQYARDLGGGLLILGGDHAFAAGGYAGTALETLSPLASTPPEPAAHWVLLIDSSGSMNAPAAGATGGSGSTRWRVAADAAVALLRSLPPEDRASVGGFAAGLSWWTRDRRAAEAAAQPLPPPGAGPGGPTELRRALADVTAEAAAGLPTQLVLLTDANADVPDAAALADAMRRRNVRLHLLAIGDFGDESPGLRAMRRLVTDTGGTLVEETDPGRWAAAARQLLRRAAPGLLETRPARLNFLGELSALPPREVAPWNRAWLKAGATVLGETGASTPDTGGADDDAGGGGNRNGRSRAPLVARWNLGEGNVAAAAFASPRPAELDALLRAVARSPRDPRLRVTWDPGDPLRVTVDAVEGDRYLNGLDLSLQLTQASRPDARLAPVPIPQTGPGRYELAVDAPREPAVATVRNQARAVDRAAVAGRYPPEFGAIGNDRAAMRELARRGGGAVIEPSFAGPLDLAGPRRDVPLSAPLAAAGAACIAAALVRWKAS
jgi:hypothetical protein